MSFFNPGYSPLGVLKQNDGSARVGHIDGRSVAENIEGVKGDLATLKAAPKEAFTNNYPSVFEMASDALKFTGWQTGEPGGVVEINVLANAGAGTNVLMLPTSTILAAGRLICYIAKNGEYYSARVKSVVGGTVTLFDELEHDVETGAVVSNFFTNSNHPNVNGYRTIADYALRTKTQRVVKNSPRLLYTKFLGGDVITTNADDNYDNPGSSGYPAVSVVTSAVGGGIYSSALNFSSGAFDIEIVINTYGNDVTLRVNVDDGELAYTDQEITINCEKPKSFKIPFIYKPDSRIYFDLRTNAAAGQFDFVLANITRVEAALKNLNSGVHVLHGDSWFALAGIAERLTARLPDATIINNGVGGRTSANLAMTFEAEVATQSPDFVWVMCGTNDYGLGVSVSGFYSWMNKLISSIRACGAIPLMFSPSVGNLIDSGAFSRSREYFYRVDYRERDIQDDYKEVVTLTFSGVSVPAGTSVFVASAGRTVKSAKVLEAYFSGVNNGLIGFSGAMGQPTIDVVTKAGNTILDSFQVPKSGNTAQYLNIGAQNTGAGAQVVSGFVRLQLEPYKVA